ncbi:MAG: iron-containing alcohol dehydrogenase [Pirellulales bacterium]|nr:iron-containing alcohol dehydrogenase [Pirellulales bacterium]
MIPFDFELRTRIVFGPARVDSLGDLARELGATRVLLVTDPGIMAAGHAPRGIDALRRAGLDVQVFDQVVENPTTDTVDVATAVARAYRPDLIVGLGGGSSMDTAKGTNFLYSCGGRMQDYWGVGKATGPMLPMIAVPTTAGTGSESQSFALISDATTHVKMACGDRRATCRVAILDPTLTVTQPPRVTADTGIDALSHALETYVTRRRTPISQALSREAWLLLEANFVRVLDEPDNLDARGAMQWGACLAGLAIENSMLGAAHALANPLTARHGVVHGQAVALMLPHVIRFNAAVVQDSYRELLECTPATNGAPLPRQGADGLAEFVTRLASQAEIPTRLSDWGIPAEELPELAADAARQWTGQFNPRTVDEANLLELYRAAY